MDEPTAAHGVKGGNMVLELVRRVRDQGLPMVLISHNMPHVIEVADRIHVARLGKRATVLNPKKVSMSDTVAVMTGAMRTQDIPGEWLAHCPPWVRPAPSPPPRLTTLAVHGCARAARTRSACASTTSASCCGPSACTVRCRRPGLPA